jgi:hypothetical protein
MQQASKRNWGGGAKSLKEGQGFASSVPAKQRSGVVENGVPNEADFRRLMELLRR